MIYFIEDDYGSRFRVWRDGDPHDQFELVPYTLFSKTDVEKLCNTLPMFFRYGDPE